MAIQFMKETVIPATNNRIEGGNLSEGEFLRYLGIWFLMATVASGVDKRAFWSDDPVNPFLGSPFRFNGVMPYTRWIAITFSF